MAFVRFALCLALFAGAAAINDGPTPVAKVISLLEDMLKEVKSDGAEEAKTYSAFACFCKDKTKSKSTDSTNSKDLIDELSGKIADKTETNNEEKTELGERKVKAESLAKELDETKVRLAKEKAEYEAANADVTKAISSLKKAIGAMKQTGGSSLVQMPASVRQNLQETLKIADVMNMKSLKNNKAATALLQSTGKASVDPDDPAYKYHSGGIIDMLEDLEKEFSDTKKDQDTDWGKTKKGLDELITNLGISIGKNKFAMGQLEKSIEFRAGRIAAHREALVDEEADLKDTELYLKDLTQRCEDRANDYDQRSSMRADEVKALTEALKILNDDVKGADEEANERAAFIQRHHKEAPKPAAAAAVAKKAEKPVAKPAEANTPVKKEVKASMPAAEKAKTATATATTKKAVSFLQMSSRSVLTESQRLQKALALIAAGGEKLHSMTLKSLAAKAAADPFKKVKGLIQKLIERLLEESKAEATKKGFCDTEMGKAEHDRDARREETMDINAKLAGLEADRDFLTEEIDMLTKAIDEETKALKLATKDRKDEKDANLKTIKTAKEGFEAVNEALLVLKKFYKQAAKASLIQASPVDEDTSGAGFEGSYKGNQSGSKAILGLLETISSDFDRTIRTTTAAEDKSARDYEEYAQSAKSSIAGKTTKKELDEQDLETTKTNIEVGFDDIKTAQNLLDAALKELEELKPTCVDSGMSYAERVQKREDEIEQLGKALCILAEGTDDEKDACPP